MPTAYGLEAFQLAASTPGTLYVVLRPPRAALCFLPAEEPYSWQPAVWRPQRVWLQQRPLDRRPAALLAQIVEGHAARISFEHLPADFKFTPCRQRGDQSFRYEIPDARVEIVSTRPVMHRRPGGEVS